MLPAQPKSSCPTRPAGASHLTGPVSTRYVSLAHQRAGRRPSEPGCLATEDGTMGLKERGAITGIAEEPTMLIVDAQIHLWNAGNPTSPWHRQIPAYLKERSEERR